MSTDELGGAVRRPVWTRPDAGPGTRTRLDGDVETGLLVVGGGLTGLWTALSAREREPARPVLLLEAARLGWAASGRNGGFCSASLTHGLLNGLGRWPGQMPELLRLGRENLDAIEDAVRGHGIDCAFSRSGELTVAVNRWQRDHLALLHRRSRELGWPTELLGASGTRDLLDSPTYLGGLLDPTGTAMLDPARLVEGLARAAEGLGADLRQDTRVLGLERRGEGIRVATTSGTVTCRQAVLATNAFRSPLRRLRPYTVPVWDHVLATEPLTDEQLESVGWSGGQGVADAGNRFHYYRLTPDRRILWGGWDTHYYFGSDTSPRRQRNAGTEQRLAGDFRRTFPQLRGVRFSHVWSGIIDTCSRFAPFWATALDGRVVSTQGFTGLGVGSSRFAAQVCLDLVEGRHTARTALDMVRTRPLPFPPEPVRWAGITLTRRALARSDEHEGRRGPWLAALDAVGAGFDA